MTQELRWELFGADVSLPEDKSACAVGMLFLSKERVFGSGRGVYVAKSDKDQGTSPDIATSWKNKTWAVVRLSTR